MLERTEDAPEAEMRSQAESSYMSEKLTLCQGHHRR